MGTQPVRRGLIVVLLGALVATLLSLLATPTAAGAAPARPAAPHRPAPAAKHAAAHVVTRTPHAKTNCALETMTFDYAWVVPSQEYLQTTSSPCRSGAAWVITIHGGSWINDDPSGVQNAVNRFASKGWQVFNMEYRRGANISWAQQANDLIAARKWILAHATAFGIDPRRGSLYGFSAGGHMAAWFGLQPQYGFRAVATAAGVLEPPMVCTAAASDAATQSEKYLCAREQKMMGCALPSDDPSCQAAWNAFDPEVRINRKSPPMIMFQGDADGTVPPNTPDVFASALTSAGVPNVVVHAPGVGHTSGCIFLSDARTAQMLSFVAKASKVGIHPGTAAAR